MEKSKKAMLLSLLFMGIGQFYNKQYIKGAIYALIEVITLIFGIPYFKKSIWGLVTLGEVKFHYVNGKAVFDHSLFLMLQGIIALLILAIIIIAYISNVYDAKKNANRMEYKKTTIHDVLDRNFPFIILAPAAVFVMFIVLFPIIFSILIAFTDFSGPYHLPPRALLNWVGLNNFKDLFKLEIWSGTFYGVFVWTVIWAILATVTTYFVGLFLALLINSNEVKFKKFWRSIIILPYAVPGFISLLVLRLMFSGPGPINDWLEAIGLQRVGWLTEPGPAKFVLVLVNMWLGAPYFMALMSSVLTNISKELYESADIDGATGVQKFRFITLPMVLYATAPLLITSFAFNFNNFNIIYFLADGGPVNPEYQYAGHTDILISWIYKLTLNQQQYHMASVVSIIIFIIIASISAYSFTQTRSFKEEDLIQ
ncbi:Maltose transport system permease protein MalF [Caloramator mitchellensis]|uniref:Maltose/maltodextrin transport system permease protein n=1 Tax=Caloramator mitchellensis TaxID=908809 RepID=A0A0R3JVW2_CALMK|nr:sugar ABC transporter permease [Caloramator mitchellensis]KRQ87667.1 Maltose transport system permease protein MalF [Caloramator mitchellensis]